MSENFEWPATVEQIAERWHCNVRWLRAHAKFSGCGRRAGRSLIFFEEDYERLKASLPRPGSQSERPRANWPSPFTREEARRKYHELIGKTPEPTVRGQRTAADAIRSLEKRRVSRLLKAMSAKPDVTKK